MMSRAAIFRRHSAIAATVLGVLLGATDLALSSEPVSAYHHVLVPADSPENWPRDDKTLLPIEADEFLDLVRTVNDPAPVASIVEAEYRARFAAGKLTDTLGWWRIEKQGKSPARLNFGVAGRAISNAKWRARTAQARLGWWPATKGHGFEHGLEVPAAGILDFDWQASETDPEQVDAFQLCLPIAAETRLVLELPPGMRPEIAASRILESPKGASSGGRWVLALPYQDSHELRIVSNDAPVNNSKSAALRETCRYAIDRSGVELEAELSISRPGSIPQPLAIHLPVGLQLVSAEIDGETIPWAAATSAEERSAQFLLNLSKFIRSGSIVVQVRAWGPLKLDSEVDLPLIAVDALFWSAGNFEVSVDESLEIVSLDARDCLQTSASVAGQDSQQRRMLGFAAFEPTAAVHAELRPRIPIGSVETGVSLEFGGGEIAGRFASRMHVEQGRFYDLRATIDPDWTIDAVETIPSDLFGEWYLDEDDEPRELHVQLARAISSGEQCQIVATGRKRMNAANSLGGAELMPLSWRNLKAAPPLVHLETGEQFDLQIDGDWNDISRASLSPAEQQLIPAAAAGRLGRIDNHSDTTIRLAAKSVAYDATVEIDASLAAEQCGIRYELVCTPRGGGLDHVLVFVDPPLGDVEWVDAESGHRLNGQRMPASDPRFGGLPADGELWQLEFGRTFARPIKVVASATVEQLKLLRLPLVSLPDAASQQGRLVLRAEGGELPSVRVQNATPAPLPLDDHVSPTTARAAAYAVFRFQPTRFYDASAAPRVEIEKLHKDLLPQPIATRFDIESRYSVDGSSVHRAVLQFDSLIHSEIALQFPTHAVIKNARIGKTEIPVTSSNRLEAPLSPSTSGPLEIEFFSRGRPLANGERLEAVFPEGSFTTLAGEWRVDLPTGYRATDPSTGLELSWQQRLFGPLARPAQSPFNPLDPGEWNQLWAQLNGFFSTPAVAAADDASIQQRIPRGMETHRFTFGPSPPSHLIVSHWQATAAWALATFMLAVASSQIFRNRLRTNILLTLVAAAISLSLPASWAPLATAATLGFAAAALWRWVERGLRPNTNILTILFAVMLSGTFVSVAPAAPIEEVLVPVDEDGQKVGSKFYVDTTFLKELLGRADAAARGGSWLIRDARCDGQLVEIEKDGNIDVGPWHLVIDVDASQRDVDVVLPLHRQDASWQANASVDGLPVPIDWNEDGTGCQVHIAEPGPSRLVIEFTPFTKEAGPRRSLKFALPAIPGTQLAVRGPRTLGDIQSSGRPLIKLERENEIVWNGTLDTNSYFDLSWAAKSDRIRSFAAPRVSLLQALELGGRGASLQLHLVKEGAWEWPETIAITADSDWAPSGSIEAIASGPLADGRETHVFSVTDRERTAPRLAFQFQSKAAGTYERLRPPDVEIGSLTVVDNWLVVTCSDSQVECKPSKPVHDVADLPPSLTSLMESPSGVSPIVVVDIKQVTNDWFLSVLPAKTVSTMRERVSVAIGKNRSRINYRGDIVPQGRDQFAASLVVPKELIVNEVTASIGEDHLPLDWVRADADRIHVTFHEPITSAYRLELHGSMSRRQNGALPIPKVEQADRSGGSQIVALYREDNISAEWQFASGPPWVESGASLESPFDDTFRFVRAYSLDSAAASKARFVVNLDEARLHGSTLTSLHRIDKGWAATWKSFLEVQHGTVDTLRLRIPTTWAGPFDISPSATLEGLHKLADGRTAELVVRLSQQAQPGDRLELSIGSPLVAAEGQGVAAPNIQLTEDGRREEYLSLPTSIDGEPLTWSRSGVELAELPAEISQAAKVTPNEAVATYRKSSESINVALRPRATGAHRASIRLAETTTFIDESHARVNSSRFVVLPGGLSRCEMDIPAGQRFVRASFDGRPALVRQLAPNRLELELRHPNLPQTLDVVTQQVEAGPAANGKVDLSIPVLLDSDRTIPIELVLWSLQGIEGFTLQPTGCKQITDAELATLRLDWMVSVAQQSSGLLLEVPAMDGFSWLARWTRSLSAAVQRVEETSSHDVATVESAQVRQPDGDLNDDSRTRAILWIMQMAEFFDVTVDTLVGNQDKTTAEIEPGSLAVQDNGEMASFVSDGYHPDLSVRLQPATWSARSLRTLELASAGLVVLISIWLSRSPRLTARLEQWPEILALLLGIAAWLWLRPSLVGLVIAIVAAVLLVRRLRRESKSPRHDSSTPPNSIPEQMAKL